MDNFCAIERLMEEIYTLYSKDLTDTAGLRRVIEEALCKVRETTKSESDEFYKQALAKVHNTLVKLFLSCDLSSDGSPKANKDSLEQSRQASISGTLLSAGKVNFSDVAGLHEAKRLLREAIVLPSMLPHLFSSTRRPWKRILLYGPPGTGKSRLAHAVSGEIVSTFYSVSSGDLLSSWFGESEKLIKELFVHARKTDGRTVIFIDEIDSLCRKRTSQEEENIRRIKTELLRQMESSNGQDDQTFLLCATNCPWELDTAFLRRFEKRIYVPLPDREARRELIRLHIGTIKHEIEEEDYDVILEHTAGFSGSDIATCVSDALLEPIRSLQENRIWRWSEDGTMVSPTSSDDEKAFEVEISSLPPEKIRPRCLTIKDIMKSFKTNHSTVSIEELVKYEEFTKVYGQKA